MPTGSMGCTPRERTLGKCRTSDDVVRCNLQSAGNPQTSKASDRWPRTVARRDSVFAGRVADARLRQRDVLPVRIERLPGLQDVFGDEVFFEADRLHLSLR